MANSETVTTSAKRGRPAGTRQAGSFASWLIAASVGDVYWSDRDQKSLIASASQAGRKITVKRFYAVNDQLVAVALVRVEVTA
jgi:hypothetical protein